MLPKVPAFLLVATLGPRLAAGEPGLHRLHPEASFRLRSQYETFEAAPDRYRARIRARLGTTYDAGHGFDFGIRFTTGSEDPTSSQLTLGNEFAHAELRIDRLFMRFQYDDWLELLVGKVPAGLRNRRLVWDRDVAPDGATQAIELGCVAGLKFHATLGEYMFIEAEDVAFDPWVLVVQAGLALERGPLEVQLDLTAYDYRNLSGAVLEFAHGANTVDADGRLVGEFGLVDALFEAALDLPIARLEGYIELTRNVRQDNANDAIAVGAELDMKYVAAGYEFRRVEREAILDALAESAWYVRRTEFLGHKVRVERALGESGWELSTSLSWMRSLTARAQTHLDWTLDVEWNL